MILKFLKEETQLKKCNSKTESKGSKTVSMTKASLKLAKSFFQKNWPKKKKKKNMVLRKRSFWEDCTKV
jgi:hypothetical protein